MWLITLIYSHYLKTTQGFIVARCIRLGILISKHSTSTYQQIVRSYFNIGTRSEKIHRLILEADCLNGTPIWSPVLITLTLFVSEMNSSNNHCEIIFL